MAKRFTSFPQFEQFHYPASLLDRLEKMVCDEMMIKKSFVNKSDANPYCGILGFAKPKMSYRSMKDLSETIQAFYKSEGFNIQKKEERQLSVKKNDESYMVFLIEDEMKYRLLIMEHPYGSFFNKRTH